MPHCILEYSDNIPDPPDHRELFGRLHTKMVELCGFKMNDIKSRVNIHRDFVMGDGNHKNGFITLNIAILSGRDDAFKKALSDAALDILSPAFSSALSKLNCSVTVQVSDLHRESYGKRISY